MSDTAMPVPPPTFEFLVLSIKMQAEMQLGLMNFGAEEEPQADLIGARHAIDMLGMLLDKTKGNLTTEEQRLIENALTELRFRFVQASQAPPPKPTESVAESVKESAEAAASPAEKVESDEAEKASGAAESAAETAPKKESSPKPSPKDAKSAAKKATEEKDEESEVSRSGIRVTDRRSGKSSAED